MYSTTSNGPRLLETLALEYHTSLPERTKWQLEDDNLKLDTLVVLKEPNLPPSKWILGRIQEIHAGQKPPKESSSGQLPNWRSCPFAE